MGDQQQSIGGQGLENAPTLVDLRDINERLLISALREQELATTLELERTRLEAILGSIGDAVLVVDRFGRPVLTNAAYRRMIGEPGATIIWEDAEGQKLPPEETPWRRAALGDTFTLEFSTLASDGTQRWWEANGRPIGHDQDEDGGGVVVMRDISARKELHRALHHQTLHDALTGLPNRTLFYDRLDQLLRTAHRNRDPLALLLLDLDHFKEVNDTLGHHAGDVVLREVASRLLLTLRAADTLARLGGDEFAMLLPGTNCDGAVVVAGRIESSLLPAIVIERQKVHIMVSVGIVISSGQDTDATMLLRQADAAMYEAKRAQSGHAIYDAAPEITTG